MTTKLFGEPVQRVEDAKLVTGRAYFLDDLGHDALGVAFVRSPHAHARVVDIDAMPSVVGLRLSRTSAPRTEPPNSPPGLIGADVFAGPTPSGVWMRRDAADGHASLVSQVAVQARHGGGEAAVGSGSVG